MRKWEISECGGGALLAAARNRFLGMGLLRHALEIAHADGDRPLLRVDLQRRVVSQAEVAAVGPREVSRFPARRGRSLFDSFQVNTRFDITVYLQIASGHRVLFGQIPVRYP